MKTNRQLMQMIREYWTGKGYKPPHLTVMTVLNSTLTHGGDGDDLLGIRSNMVNGLPIGGPLQ